MWQQAFFAAILSTIMHPPRRCISASWMSGMPLLPLTVELARELLMKRQCSRGAAIVIMAVKRPGELPYVRTVPSQVCLARSDETMPPTAIIFWVARPNAQSMGNPVDQARCLCHHGQSFPTTLSVAPVLP